MKIKIKCKPEDFIVEEIANLPLKPKGGFPVYLIKKEGWNTVGLLLELSKKLKIPFVNFSYGGKKDRYGLTRQYITIKGRQIRDLKAKDYSLKLFGFMDRPMGPDLIEANRFEITVRDLTADEIKEVEKEIGIVDLFGYPNYFDDQRFGSFDSEQGFLAQKLLVGHFNGAVKMSLTSIHPQDNKAEKERKRYFSENWKKWELLQKAAVTESEKKVFDFLIKNPTGFLPLLKQMPREQLSIYIGAYQAYIWNELLRRFIKQRIASDFKVYPGVCGDYVFYAKLDKNGFESLRNLEIPTASSKAQMPDELTDRIYSCILEEPGIKKNMFNKLKIRQVFFKSASRKFLIKPQDFSINTAEDELYAKKTKMILKFTLPRGSYGTMLVKRLFSTKENKKDSLKEKKGG